MRHTIFGGILFLLLALGGAGCGGTTPYQSRSLRGGYEEERLSENTFRILFAGNAYTSRSLALTYAQLRAAEVVVAHGYSHFRILDRTADHTAWKDKTIYKYEHESGATYKLTRTELITYPKFYLTVQGLYPSEKENFSDAIDAEALVAANPTHGFTLSPVSFAKLRTEAQVPAQVIDSLQPLEGKKFDFKSEFTGSLLEIIGVNSTEKYESLILQAAERYSLR